jgi:hypothetical protein
MTDAGGCVVAVVAEAAADQATGCALADRVLSELIDWLDDTNLEHVRKYRGLQEDALFLRWTDAMKEATRRRIPVHGHLHGALRAPDEVMAERALRLLAVATPDARAVVLLRDADKEEGRRAGFEQARSSHNWPFEVVVGVANTKRECWVLAGYEPRNEPERALLDAERKALGFDPRIGADGLTASADGAKRDAKRVLGALTQGDAQREHGCLSETSLETLRARGQRTGLAAFLADVEERLGPLLDPRVRRLCSHGGCDAGGGSAYLSSAELLPSTRRAMISSWICWVPSKMSRILESRAHFSTSSVSA